MNYSPQCKHTMLLLFFRIFSYLNGHRIVSCVVVLNHLLLGIENKVGAFSSVGRATDF